MKELSLPSGLTATFEKNRVTFVTDNSAKLHVSLRSEFDKSYWDIETDGRWVVGKKHIKQLIEALQYVLDSCE